MIIASASLTWLLVRCGADARTLIDHAVKLSMPAHHTLFAVGALNNRAINGLPLCNEAPIRGAERVSCQNAGTACQVLPANILEVRPAPHQCIISSIAMLRIPLLALSCMLLPTPLLHWHGVHHILVAGCCTLLSNHDPGLDQAAEHKLVAAERSRQADVCTGCHVHLDHHHLLSALHI